MKYIVVSGGVMSGIGKGIVTSSVGAILQACNLKVTAIKIDPYLNVDAGTFSPYEHGETYVLDDGSEVDLDLGNYERFLEVRLGKSNNITSGKIYKDVVDRERQGDYLGKTVTVIPHVTDAIQEWIQKAAGPQFDVCLIELGGTIGDIEGQPFIEAVRQLKGKLKKTDMCLIHVSYILCLGPSNDQKTKPTQMGISKLKELGLEPQLIVGRCIHPLSERSIGKISFYSTLEKDRVFSLPDLKTIYGVPSELNRQGIIKAISECLGMNLCPCDRINRWEKITSIALNSAIEITIGLVGKYTSSHDCYTSVSKSLEHACYELKARPNIRYINSELLENDDQSAWDNLKTSDCIIVPGGFGIRGVEGKVRAINYARDTKTPFLGVCLGFQMAVVEYARDKLNITDAHSAEFADELDRFTPLIVEMLEYVDPERRMGGTMRLGLRTTKFVTETSILKTLYGQVDSIEERHRHRYEINPKYISDLEAAGMKFVGKNEDESRMEILELSPTEHPYFVGVQYHPEYLSRPFRPSPPYVGLIKAALCHFN